jgi:drug/metabolite transporter (DMT)-like permease
MALTSALFWSFSYVCIQELLQTLGSLGASAWLMGLLIFQIRMAITALAFLPHVIHGRKWFRLLNQKDWIVIWILMLTMTFGYHIPLNIGAQSLPSGFVSLIIALTPVIAAILARFVLRESLNPQRILAISLGFTGIILCLVSQGKLHLDSTLLTSDLFAPLLLVCSACNGAVSTVLGKRLRKDMPLGFILGVILLLTVMLGAFLWSEPLLLLVKALDLKSWLCLFYLAIPSTYVATLLWYRALRTLDAVEVSIYLNVTTVFAIIWGMLVFGEGVSMLYAIGAACIISAVFLTTRKAAKPSA